jgi:hypothetical protein
MLRQLCSRLRSNKPELAERIFMEISNADLRLENIPHADAEWNAIAEFSLTFNGYEYWGSFGKCAEVARQPVIETLTELRTSLFFIFRAIRHGGYGPTEKDIEKVKSRLVDIRAKVQANRRE